MLALFYKSPDDVTSNGDTAMPFIGFDSVIDLVSLCVFLTLKRSAVFFGVADALVNTQIFGFLTTLFSESRESGLDRFLSKEL